MSRFNQFGQDDGGGWFFQQRAQFDDTGDNFFDGNYFLDRNGDGIPDHLDFNSGGSRPTGILGGISTSHAYDRNHDGIPDHWQHDTNHDSKIDVWAYDGNGDGKPDQWAFDINGDGKPDSWAFDADNDGNIDQWAYDKDNDGKADYWEADFNGDGKIDQWGYDKNNDGRQDYWEIDTNGDGKIDQWAYDKNNDGIADYWVGDRNGDGKKDKWGYDKNNDRKVDYNAYDTDNDGKPDYWERDTNGNGYFDQCAFDNNRDGKPDKWKRKKSEFIIILHEKTLVGNMGPVKERVRQALEPYVQKAGKQLKLVVSRIPVAKKHLDVNFPPSIEANADLHLYFYGGTKFTGPGMAYKGRGVVLGDGTGNISVDSHLELRFKGLQSVFELGDKGLAIDIANTAVHEIGHMLGLEHSKNPKSFMYAGEPASSLRSLNTLRRFLSEQRSFTDDTTKLTDHIRMGKVDEKFKVRGAFGR
jgi:hypothetical protein